MRIVSLLAHAAALLLATATTPSRAADEFERPPFEYSRTTPANCISALQERLDRGDAELEFQEGFGYLPDLLGALGVPIDSQMLVFSKTSLQRRRISPRRPRAIYFNDEVYVGYCQSGDLLEISAVDPQLGTVFYTLDQQQSDAPRFVRQTDSCLQCHTSSRSGGVPGHVVRSLYVDDEGEPILSASSFTVDHTTPLEHRWGGWYVTGEHGWQSHLGNLIVRGKHTPTAAENSEGQNVLMLGNRCDVGKYLAPHSDIVALMVFEHQTLVQNCLTKANFTVRKALHDEAELNRTLGKSESSRSESLLRRIQSAGDELVDALLLVGEAPLSDSIRGTSGFAEQFAAAGPRDANDRSLRDLDLELRLFKYPCSYLIYSPSFEALPPELKDYVWQRLWDVLAQGSDAKRFLHLTPRDRTAIIEILRDTTDSLPRYWR
jgi:hypothetical protein